MLKEINLNENLNFDSIFLFNPTAQLHQIFKTYHEKLKRGFSNFIGEVVFDVDKIMQVQCKINLHRKLSSKPLLTLCHHLILQVEFRNLLKPVQVLIHKNRSLPIDQMVGRPL